MDDSPDIILTGEKAGDYFGGSVSGIGDYNGDGYADIAIGAFFNDQAGKNAGKVYIYYGNENLNKDINKAFIGEQMDDNFGIAISKCGHISDSHKDAFVIGAYFNSSLKLNAGRAYLYINNE